MGNFRPFLLLLILLFLFPLVALQAQESPRLEITGVNASEMPSVTVTANVYDTVGQPVRGLTAADFALMGDLSGAATITSVENITDNNLPFAVVLAVDVSTSMLGSPLDNAKRAAQAFVENIGADDPVAIVSFADGARVEQDYTTDKAALAAAIERLDVNGRTALYQGAYDAVTLAASSPTPRRAVILLSDGAEYGGLSTVGRDAAASEALVRGVPVYTIGLGFGADRSFLEQLSGSTNARLYESPTSDQLTEIYTDLAARLRSQYVITLDAPLPLDGTQYNLGLQVTTPQGSAEASAVLRAPIPVPIVRLPDQPDPLNGLTEIEATILADDPITSVTFSVGDQQIASVTEAPYTVTIDPVDYPPGGYFLSVSATDDDGDTGSGVVPFSVAALPSVVMLSPDLASLVAIAEPQTVTVEIGGQTPATDVSVDLGDGPVGLSEVNSFTIDPILFPAGANTLAVTVTNEGGITSTQVFPFTVAALPPQVSIVGLQDGQSIGEPVSFSAAVTAQDDGADVSARVDDVVLNPDENGSFTLDPMSFTPGAHTVTVTATAGGRSGTAQVNVVVAALPPQVSVSGLTAGDVIAADRELTFNAISQTPVTHIAVSVDDGTLADLTRAPYTTTLPVLDYAPGDHTLFVTATNASGGESTISLPFTVASAPAATATAAAVMATQAAVSTSTQQAVSTAAAVMATQAAQATGTQIASASETAVVVMATQAAQATATQVAQVTQTATAAEATQAAQATATQVAQATATEAVQQTATAVEATRAAQSTQVAQAMLDAAATQNAQATQAALATLQVEAVTATQVAQATATAAQQSLAAATGDARSTQQAITDATGTAVIVSSMATQAALTEEATAAAATGTQAALATGQAQNTGATQSALDVTATQAALAVGTQDVQATATQSAQATATQAAQATQDARATMSAVTIQQAQNATLAALSTANAEARQQGQATQDARATRNAIATETRQANATATAAQATEEAIAATATQVILNATATIEQATQDAVSTLNALEATATQRVVAATETRVLLETQTSQNLAATQTAAAATAVTIVEATQVAQTTLDAQIAAATAERSGQQTATSQVLADSATGTASVDATARALALATEAQATVSAGATATENALGTLQTRQTAVGPTATPEPGAQNAPSPTPQPSPTLTEIQSQEPPASSDIAPILIVVIVIIVIILVLVLIMRGRGAPIGR